MLSANCSFSPALLRLAAAIAVFVVSLPVSARPSRAPSNGSTPTAQHVKPKETQKKPARGGARKPGVAKPVAPPRSAPEGPDATTKIPADISALGALSIGHPHAGYLLNSTPMPRSPRWVLTVPSHGFGTEETVAQLQHCLNQVHDQFPGSHPVMLGSLSGQFGGHLPPHRSHRTGRDADVYFFRQPGAQWSKAATREDIDLPRTWALLRCFITDTDVEMILIVRKVQDWLEKYALSQGENKQWLDSLFHDNGSYKTALVRDVPGHVAHMHVRFVSAQARRKAVKVYDRLVSSGVVRLSGQADKHVVVKGDTLSELAEHYKTSVAQLQSLNGLEGTLIKLGQKLVIHKPVDLRGARDPVFVPPRRRPPAPTKTVSAPQQVARLKTKTSKPAGARSTSFGTDKSETPASWTASDKSTDKSLGQKPKPRQKRLKDPFSAARRAPQGPRDLS